MSGLQASDTAESSAETASAIHRVLLVDRLAMLRECMAYALQAAGKDFLVLTAASPAETGPLRPDVVILNIHAAGVDSPSVLQDLAALRERYDQGTPIVVVSDLTEIRGAIEAIRYRLRGYIPTSLNAAVAVAAIRLVLAGGSFFPAELMSVGTVELGTQMLPVTRPQAPVIPATVAEPTNAFGFTSRETEVANLLRQGKPNKIIAFELSISESTVKVHLRSVMKKLQARNRTEAVCRIQNMALRLEAA